MKNRKTILLAVSMILIGGMIGFLSGAKWVVLTSSVDVSYDFVKKIRYGREEPISKPNPDVFQIAINAIKDYRSEFLQWNEKCILKLDIENGVIETNWYPVHKSEVSEKIRVFIWGTNYRIDVWRRSNWNTLSKYRLPSKGEHALALEIYLQEAIEAGLTSILKD